MQDQDGDGRGEGSVGKGQRCRVALHDAGAVSMLLRKLYGECMVVFETGYARNALSQLGSGGPWPGANFEKVIAQVRSAQDKRQDLVAGCPSPRRGRAEPVLEGVHWLISPREQEQGHSRKVTVFGKLQERCCAPTTLVATLGRRRRFS